HHHFTDKELQQLQGLRVLTTEKDYVRFEQSWEGLYYLPIDMQFCTNEDAVKFGTVFGALTQE
ncbi:tetraacyldisaccharide 4'-kinase, partial [Paraprevotella clara]